MHGGGAGGVVAVVDDGDDHGPQDVAFGGARESHRTCLMLGLPLLLKPLLPPPEIDTTS